MAYTLSIREGEFYDNLLQFLYYTDNSPKKPPPPRSKTIHKLKHMNVRFDWSVEVSTHICGWTDNQNQTS